MRKGKLTRVLRSQKLCDKDSNEHRYPTSKAVKLIADRIMSKVNNEVQPTGDDMKIADFWTQHYLPYCESGYKGHGMRPSSVRGFHQVWRQHLEPHFGDLTLRAYKGEMARRFLSSLKTKQCKNTLRHIRGLASAMFSEAVERGLVSANPWAGVKIPKDCKDSKPKGWYTREQIENMISALADHPDMQAVIAIVCWLGLRPGEANALRWEDVADGFVHVRRNIVRGVVGLPKTAESVRDIPMVKQVKQPLAIWWAKSGRPKEGWVFPSDGVLNDERCAPEMKHLVGGPAPLDLHNALSRIVLPKLRAKKIEWRGLYSGRRAAITMLIEATDGNYHVAQAMAGHKLMSTTVDIYKGRITPKGFAEGMKQYERKMLKG